MGDPASAVAVLAIVNVFEAVNLGVWIGAGGFCFCSKSSESDVRRATEDFQFVDTRFQSGGGVNREAQMAGMKRRNALRIEPRMNRGAKAVRIDAISDLSERFK